MTLYYNMDGTLGYGLSIDEFTNQQIAERFTLNNPQNGEITYIGLEPSGLKRGDKFTIVNTKECDGNYVYDPGTGYK